MIFTSKAKKKQHILDNIKDLNKEKERINQEITVLQFSNFSSIDTFQALKDIRLRLFAVDDRLRIKIAEKSAMV